MLRYRYEFLILFSPFQHILFVSFQPFSRENLSEDMIDQVSLKIRCITFRPLHFDCSPPAYYLFSFLFPALTVGGSRYHEHH